jgi:hypothetical protein
MWLNNITSSASSLYGGTRRSLRNSVKVVATSVALVFVAAPAAAQLPAFEVRPMTGAYVPLGAQGDFLAGANMFGAQASWLMTPTWALTGSFARTGSEDKLTPVRQRINLMNYDAGIEARVAPPPVSAGWTFSPFIGLGAGARTYDYKDLDMASKTYGAAYGALGAEVGYDMLGVRFEARDYVSRFRPLSASSGSWDYRNDLTLSVGLNLRIW